MTIFVGTNKEVFFSEEGTIFGLISRVTANTSRSVAGRCRVVLAATYIQCPRELVDHHHQYQYHQYHILVV